MPPSRWTHPVQLGQERGGHFGIEAERLGLATDQNRRQRSRQAGKARLARLRPAAATACGSARIRGSASWRRLSRGGILNWLGATISAKPLGPALRPADQHDPASAAALVLHPQRRHRRPPADGHDQVRPGRLEPGRSVQIEMVEPGLEGGLAQHPFGLGNRPAAPRRASRAPRPAPAPARCRRACRRSAARCVGLRPCRSATTRPPDPPPASGGVVADGLQR